MIGLGLTMAQQRAYEDALTETHLMRTTVRILNLDGDALSDVSNRFDSGQVNIDTDAETSRQLSINLDDPEHALGFDSNAPDDGAVYADRMIQALYGVYVDALSDWIDCPVFTGPITNMSRDGATVSLSALGKEHLASAQAWRPLTLKKGTLVTAAIRTIMRERAGETQFALPTLSARLPQDVSLGIMSSPWKVVQSLAKSVSRQLYYDGAGYLRLRTLPTGAVYTFRSGGGVLSDPKVTYDLSEIINTIRVKGGKPKGAKRAVTASVVAPTSHPLSPARLGRNGVGRYLVEEIENEKVRSVSAAKRLGNDTLNARLIEGVTCDFDALPVPHLDPGDVVRLATDEASVTFRIQKASIPLTHDGVMAVGHHRRVTPKARRAK